MFSQAGTRSGVDAISLLGGAMTKVLDGDDVHTATIDRITFELMSMVEADLAARASKRKGPVPTDDEVEDEARRRAAMAALVLEPARYVEALHPEWIALEQVPAVLPLWQVLADGLRRLGYSAWTGHLCAADFGVAQTRTRAILVASRTRTVHPPAATHAETPHPTLFGATLDPWISMADALGWVDRAEWVVDTSNNSTLGGGRHVKYRRSVDRPSPTLTGNVGRGWRLRSHAGATVRHRDLSRPAPTLIFGKSSGLGWEWVETPEPAASGVVCGPAGLRGPLGSADPEWAAKRPATTLAGRALAPHPGHTREQNDPTAKSRNDGLRLVLEEALVLQSFPPSHDIAGNLTSQFLQVGNAVPPLLAGHVLAAATGLEPPRQTVTVLGPPATPAQ